MIVLIVCVVIFIIVVVILRTRVLNLWIFTAKQQRRFYDESKRMNFIPTATGRDAAIYARSVFDKFVNGTINAADGSNFDVSAVALFAEIRRRRNDGLIIIRPIGWYVYYERGGPFYYLTSSTYVTSINRKVCSPGETASVIFTPEKSVRTIDVFHTRCIAITTIELLNMFAGLDPDVVSLDDLLRRAKEQINVIYILNELIAAERL